MEDNTFDIKGGSNQILPNAKEANQYFMGDSSIKITQQFNIKKVGQINYGVKTVINNIGTNNDFVSSTQQVSQTEDAQEGSET